MRLLLLGLTVQAVSGLVAGGCGVIPCSSLLPPRLPPPCSSLFAQRELEEGAEWQGLISRITEYGAFVTLGHEQVWERGAGERIARAGGLAAQLESILAF